MERLPLAPARRRKTLCKSNQDSVSISPQYIGRRTLKRNVTPESCSFWVRSRKKEDFAPFSANSLDGELLAFRGAVAVQGDPEGVSRDRLYLGEQVRIPVLYMYAL